MFRIKMTGYYVDTNIAPDVELLPEEYTTRDEAYGALTSIVDKEIANLNSGDADGEFVDNYGGDDHDCVVEFWEGEPTENDRSFRPVSVYDIVEV